MLLLAGISVGAVVGVALADVVLQYQAKGTVAGTSSPFGFTNGANYAVANGAGFVANVYPNPQKVSISATLSGANGAYGTYLLDTLEVVSLVTGTTTWKLGLTVSTALMGTGINAVYLFYCTSAPTGVPVSGTPVASGTDANGNPWAIFAPTCTGTAGQLSLQTTASGTVVTLAGTTSGTTVLYLSFGLAVTNTGATTTTAAVLFLTATA